MGAHGLLKRDDIARSPSCGDINTIQRSFQKIFTMLLCLRKTTVRDISYIQMHMSGLLKLLNILCYQSTGLYLGALSSVQQPEQTDHRQLYTVSHGTSHGVSQSIMCFCCLFPREVEHLKAKLHFRWSRWLPSVAPFTSSESQRDAHRCHTRWVDPRYCIKKREN